MRTPIHELTAAVMDATPQLPHVPAGWYRCRCHRASPLRASDIWRMMAHDGVARCPVCTAVVAETVRGRVVVHATAEE